MNTELLNFLRDLGAAIVIFLCGIWVGLEIARQEINKCNPNK